MLPEKDIHINLLELRAIRFGLLHLEDMLRGRTTAVFSDNMTALSYLLKQGGTHSSSLNAEAQATLSWAERSALAILTQFVPDSSSVAILSVAGLASAPPRGV